MLSAYDNAMCESFFSRERLQICVLGKLIAVSVICKSVGATGTESNSEAHYLMRQSGQTVVAKGLSTHSTMEFGIPLRPHPPKPGVAALRLSLSPRTPARYDILDTWSMPR